MWVCSYLLWQKQMFWITFTFRDAELICLFIRACKCWQQTTRKIRGITNNLLTFRNVSCLLPLRLAQGSRKRSFQDPGPPSSHTVIIFGFKLHNSLPSFLTCIWINCYSMWSLTESQAEMEIGICWWWVMLDLLLNSEKLKRNSWSSFSAPIYTIILRVWLIKWHHIILITWEVFNRFGSSAESIDNNYNFYS